MSTDGMPHPGGGGTGTGGTPPPMVKVLILPHTADPINERFAESVEIPCWTDEQVVEISREVRDSVEAIRRKYHP